ncbi:MAG: choline dehydrogenase-like flavoprotein [Acidimicrobiales bacterium]
MYDVVVVGAGVGGCVAARRLADAGLSVLLLEAGGADAPAVVTGTDALAAARHPGWVWPTPDYLRGRGLGGGSAVNGMVMMAGDQTDLHQWGGSALIAELNRVVDELRPVPKPHGQLASAFRLAARSVGHPSAPSSAVLDQTGLLTAALAFVDGRRRTAADVYLSGSSRLHISGQSGSAGGADVTVLAEAEVAELTGSGSNVDGVRLVNGEVYRARHVVLSAGALVSPQLLLARGLGNEHVGRGLKDHPAIGLPVGLGHAPASDRVPITTVLRWSSVPGANDLLTMPIESLGHGGSHLGMLLTAAVTTDTEGSVSATSYNLPALASEADRARLRSAVRGTMALLTESAFTQAVTAVFLDDQGTPISQFPDADAELDTWMESRLGGIYHAGCSCRFGRATGAGGVVLGARGVSVIDASSLPDLPRANPQLAILAVASLLAGQLASVLVST